jgi:hypothetical protein
MLLHRPDAAAAIDSIGYHPYLYDLSVTKDAIVAFRADLTRHGMRTPIEINEIGSNVSFATAEQWTSVLTQLSVSLPRSGCGITRYMPFDWGHAGSPGQPWTRDGWYEMLDNSGAPTSIGQAYIDAVSSISRSHGETLRSEQWCPTIPESCPANAFQAHDGWGAGWWWPSKDLYVSASSHATSHPRLYSGACAAPTLLARSSQRTQISTARARMRVLQVIKYSATVAQVQVVATVRARRRTRVSVCVNVPGSGTGATLCRRATVGDQHRTLVIGIEVPRPSSARGNTLTGKVDIGGSRRTSHRMLRAMTLG